MSISDVLKTSPPALEAHHGTMPNPNRKRAHRQEQNENNQWAGRTLKVTLKAPNDFAAAPALP
jgi:hypothetical protein